MTTTAQRTASLRQMLTDRRLELQADINGRIRDGRADRSNEVRDVVDLCDVGIEEELAFQLLQMRAEMLARVDGALARLDAGTYGTCYDCGAEISSARLRAVPFAARCINCEERREREQRASRPHAGHHGSTALSPEFQPV